MRSVHLSPGLMVGADRQIAARAVVDAFGRNQAFGAQIGRGRRAFARPADRPARHRQRRSARTNSCRAAPSRVEPGSAGLTQPTVMPGWSAMPNIAPSGGTFFSRKLIQLITQPVSPARLHSGVFLNVPPTSLPLRDEHVVAGHDRQLHPRRDRRIGLDLARDQLCSIRLPWLWPISTNGRPLLLVAR